jgi:RNA polymerase sigma factor (sigma-70 family)
MEELFRAHYDYIRKVAAHACRKYSLSREEVEDFTQIVLLKIVADDYAVLRKFRGDSSRKTYLNMVVQNAMGDYINHLWGKWRPSEEAKRQGELAIQLERLLVRDGYSWDAACQKLWTDYKVTKTESELADIAIATKLLGRPPRRPEVPEGERDAADRGDPRRHRTDPPANPLTSPAEAADEGVLREERQRRRDHISAVLTAALETLSDEDRVIIQLWTRGFKAKEIADNIHCEPKPLYRRVKGIQNALKALMIQGGIRPEDVDDILGHADTDT